MKKIMISMTLLLAVLAAQAQSDPKFASKQARKEMRKERKEQRITVRQLEGTDVSEQSKAQFQSDFGNMPDVTWSRDLYFDKATFTNSKGTKTSAFYDYNGQLVGTSTPSSFASLPMSAQQKIMKHYTNYQDAPVIFYDDNESNETDMILYGVQFEDADNYFIEVADKKGRPVVLKVTPAGEVSWFTDLPTK